MEIVPIILGLLSLVEQIMARSSQSGELTAEQRAALKARADAIFTQYANAPPPPKGVK